MMKLIEKFQKHRFSFYPPYNNQHFNDKIISINKNSILFLIIMISIINFANGNESNKGDLEQINGIMGIGDAPEILSQQQESQQQQQNHEQHQKQNEEILQDQNDLHDFEKRSLQNIQGSWNRRIFDDPNDYIQLSLKQGHQMQQHEDDFDGLINNDDNILPEYNDERNYLPSSLSINRNGIIPLNSKYENNEKILIPDQLLWYKNEQKRGWNSMSGAWGKRLSSNGDNWNRFRGSWGKREPGWNNLKGLWGKRATNWNKLQSAWGKRDHAKQDSY